jgi:hypothetical protein
MREFGSGPGQPNRGNSINQAEGWHMRAVVDCEWQEKKVPQSVKIQVRKLSFHL